MSKVYEKPPLVEALCEIHFHSGKSWDATIPGLYFNQISDSFGLVEDEQDAKGKTDIEGGRGHFAHTTIQFKSHDGDRVVQLQPDELTINVLTAAYKRWSVFKELVLLMTQKYGTVASPEGIGEITLRFINRLEIPVLPEQNGIVEVSKYLNMTPRMPKISGSPLGYIIRTDLLQPEGIIGISSWMNPGQSVSKGMIELYLDIALVRHDQALMETNDIGDWLDGAHDRIEEAFQALLTPEAKALFGTIEEVNRDDT